MNCANHPDRTAGNLCMGCGRWFCDSCMDKSQVPPVCANCSGISKVRQPEAEIVGVIGRIISSSNRVKIFIKVGLGVFFASVLGLTILFQIKGVAFLLDINYNFLRYIPVFIAFVAVAGGFILLGRKPHEKAGVPGKNKKETITAAQIETLLRIDGKLTPSRLAGATNTSKEYAKKVLNDMAAEGILNVSSPTDAYELVYSKNLLPR